jgi:hypothetical protein
VPIATGSRSHRGARSSRSSTRTTLTFTTIWLSKSEPASRSR